MPLNDLLKLIEQAFKLRDLRFYLRELGSWGLADQYLLSKQPSQLGFLPPEGVNDIDRGLCHFRLLIVRAFLVGFCLAVSPGPFQQCFKAASESIRIPKGRG